jgi:hypothetical protein
MGLRPRRQGEAPADADQPKSDGTQDTNSLREQAEALFSRMRVTPALTSDADKE